MADWAPENSLDLVPALDSGSRLNRDGKEFTLWENWDEWMDHNFGALEAAGYRENGGLRVGEGTLLCQIPPTQLHQPGPRSIQEVDFIRGGKGMGVHGQENSYQ